MKTQTTSLPVKTLGASLRRITEYLAREVVRPSAHAPNWSDTDWRISTAVMALQGMAVPLASTLKWRGPDYWQAHLQKQRTHVALRYQYVARFLTHLDSALRTENVAVVALKGIALYRTQVYSNGERCFGDIDLLADSDDLEAATRAIVASGYRQSFAMRRHVVFEPAGEKQSATFDEDIANPIKIELHTRIAEPLPFNEVDVTASILPARRGSGIIDYASRASLMRHLLLHAAGNIRARALRQIQLHDIALLAPQMTRGDWDELLVTDDERGLWWALAPLKMTARYYDGRIPADVIAATEKGCPAWLRRVTQQQELTDVSWSNIRIQAFPGIEWSKTPFEALHFARGRVVPRRTELSMLEHAVTVLPWAAQIPWYGQSHLTRILRWVFSRPPRVQTMYSVQAALARRP